VRISDRNGREPVCPDLRNAPHPAPKLTRFGFCGALISTRSEAGALLHDSILGWERAFEQNGKNFYGGWLRTYDFAQKQLRIRTFLWISLFEKHGIQSMQDNWEERNCTV